MKSFYKIIIFFLLILKTATGFSQEKKDSFLSYTPTSIDTTMVVRDSTKMINTALKITPVKRRSGLIATIGVAAFSTSMLSMWQKSANSTRGGLVAGGSIVAYGGAMIGLYSLWYKKYPQSKFHFFNDNKEWLQVDKVSHAYGAYMEGRVSMEMWKWAGTPKRDAIWFGGLSGLAYEAIIEILDGYSAEWGFSCGDFLANMAGSALLVSQELAWGEQRIQMRYSTHPVTYPDDAAHIRVNELFGKTKTERLVKDYNPQTYWLTVNYASFFKDKMMPSWLPVSFGYGGQNMFGAFVNTGEAKGLQRYRQWYIAPDIDLTKFKTNSDLLNTLFFVMTLFHFPSPSIEISRKKVKVHWLHF